MSRKEREEMPHTSLPPGAIVTQLYVPAVRTRKSSGIFFLGRTFFIVKDRRVITDTRPKI